MNSETVLRSLGERGVEYEGSVGYEGNICRNKMGWYVIKLWSDFLARRSEASMPSLPSCLSWFRRLVRLEIPYVNDEAVRSAIHL